MPAVGGASIPTIPPPVYPFPPAVDGAQMPACPTWAYPSLSLLLWGRAWRALTLDGNTVVQGLAEVQIILLIMHSGKQLPRTKGIQQTGNGPTSPTTVQHASSVISTFIWSNISLWRLLFLIQVKAQIPILVIHCGNMPVLRF